MPITRPITDASRGKSPAIWSQVPLSAILNGHFDKGWAFMDDFMGDHDLTNAYTATQATAGTFAITDAKGGVADADCNSNTVTQGINVQASSTVGERFTATSGVLAFEALVKATDIATGPEFFCGMAVIDTTIIGTSALSAQSIGLSSVTADGVLLSGTKDGSSAATGTGTTLADGTWVKLGFVAESGKVRFYVDGTLVNTETTYIPTTEMVPSLVCQSDGTTDSIVSIDWWIACQHEALTR